MKKKLAALAFAGATIGMFAAAPGAGAAHCTDDGGPGNSDFATHVRARNGPGGHDEGDHKGWSTCEENSRNFGS